MLAGALLGLGDGQRLPAQAWNGLLDQRELPGVVVDLLLYGLDRQTCRLCLLTGTERQIGRRERLRLLLRHPRVRARVGEPQHDVHRNVHRKVAAELPGDTPFRCSCVMTSFATAGEPATAASVAMFT